MSLKQIKAQVKSFEGKCDTLCGECSSVRGIIPLVASANGSGIITGSIVPDAQNKSIWTEGCDCYVNFQYDDDQLVVGTILRPCDVCLVCGCIVEFVERSQGGVAGGFNVQSGAVSAYIASGETLRINGSGLVTTTLTPGSPDTLIADVSCAAVRTCVGSDLLTNNNNNTFTHQAVDSQISTINFNYGLSSPTPGFLQLIKPNGQVDTVDVCAVVNAGCPPQTSPAIAVTSTPSLQLAASGPLNHNLTGNVLVSGDAGNAISIHGGGNPGLFAPVVPSDSLVNNGNNTFTHVASNGISTTINTEHSISAGPGTSLRLTRPNAVAQDVDLCPIITACSVGSQTPITPVDTSTIDLSVSGLNNHTLQANLIVSPNVGNQASILGNGLFVPLAAVTTCADVRGCLSALDTTSIDTTFSSGQISSALIVDPVAGNLVIVGAAGVSVTCESVQDCVGAGMAAANGLAYNDAANRFEVAISPNAGNGITQLANGIFAPSSGGGGPTATLTDNGNRTFTFSNGVNPVTNFCQGVTAVVGVAGAGNIGANNMIRSANLAGCTLTLDVAPEHTAQATTRYQEFYSFPNSGLLNVPPNVNARQLWNNVPLLATAPFTNPSAYRSMLLMVTLEYGAGYLVFSDGSGNSTGAQFEFNLIDSIVGSTYGGRLATTVDPTAGAPSVTTLSESQGSITKIITLAPSQTVQISSDVNIFIAAMAPVGYQGSVYEIRQRVVAYGVTI